MKRQIANDFVGFSHFQMRETETFYTKTAGKTKTHERVL